MKIACCLVLVVSTLPVLAAGNPAAPEVKKTVEAFVGTWNLRTTMTLPGAPPATFAEKVVCERTAMGRAVSCVDTATVPGMGATEYAYLLGYDEETRAVHLFAIGSPGEVHDHKCVWKGDVTLDCEPLRATMGGSAITEAMSFVFAGDDLTLRVTTMTGGGEVGIQASGRRVGH